MSDDLPEVLTVSSFYADRHMGELTAHVVGGGYARIINLNTGMTCWLTADEPAGVVADLTLERARKQQSRRQSSKAKARQRRGGRFGEVVDPIAVAVGS